MRVVAEIPHPECKITIFSMNSKYIMKFEQGAIEQTYKLAEMDIVNGVDGVFEIIDETFMKSVIENFKGMRAEFIATYNRNN